MSSILKLYTGPHCHLCDQAKQVIYPVVQGTHWQLQEESIAGNAVLEEKYALRIPVVVMSDGREKGWPFTSGQIKRLINDG